MSDEWAIHIRVEKPTALQVAIFGVDGKLVRSLNLGPQRVGEQQVIWDGRDEEQRKLPSGIYLFTLSLNHSSTSGKIIKR